APPPVRIVGAFRTLPGAARVRRRQHLDPADPACRRGPGLLARAVVERPGARPGDRFRARRIADPRAGPAAPGGPRAAAAFRRDEPRTGASHRARRPAWRGQVDAARAARVAAEGAVLRARPADRARTRRGPREHL